MKKQNHWFYIALQLSMLFLIPFKKVIAILALFHSVCIPLSGEHLLYSLANVFEMVSSLAFNVSKFIWLLPVAVSVFIFRSDAPTSHGVISGASFVKSKKGKFSYSAVSSPYDCSKWFYTLLPRQTCSIKYQCYNLRVKGCAYTYPPLSIARYSFIQLNEL